MGEVCGPAILEFSSGKGNTLECAVPVCPSAVPADTFTSASVQLPSDWTLGERDLCDLEMLLSGAFAPLKGYLCREDYFSVLNNMRLTTGEVWPIPIVLAIPESVTTPNVHWMQQSSNSASEVNVAAAEAAQSTETSKILCLRDSVGTIVAEVVVTDVYRPNLELERERVLGSTDKNHPYADYLIKHHANCYYVGGEICSKAPIERFDFKEYRLSCKAVREFIKQKGWDVVVGFQTRNPMHRSHFELTRQALREASAEEGGKQANLLLTPAVGPTQPGDIAYHIRVRCYKKILKYYNEEGDERVKVALLPLAMRMAGPREAVWHAIIRKNYGCTHFIVGRDHAGPSVKKSDGTPFYGPYEAHELLKSVQDELGIKPIFGKAMVYAGEENGGYLQADQVPQGVEAHNISGTELRKRLQTREKIPEWFSFPEVVEELYKFYVPPYKQGLCVYFTGLPSSGKSTLANAVAAVIQQNENESRQVTLLDADVIRTHLSRGLGFSKEDRSVNVRRIGYVASEVVKHGGICLVANIAPYEEDREYNRKIITSSMCGGYVDVFVSTPLSVCEGRDVKGLYRKARQGVIKQFTGISDPYQQPSNAEVVVDSTDNLQGKVEEVMRYLKEAEWIR